MKIENILIPTDFSESSDNAFSVAIELAHVANARLFLMHAAQRTYSYASERLVERIKTMDRLDGLVTDTIVEIGDPANSILTQVEKTGADLIVMGSTGRSKTRKKLFGSVSMAVISKSPVPVLLIPEKCAYRNFDNIVFTTDFHSGDLAALKQYAKIAGLFDSELHVLHVATRSGSDADSEFKQFKKRAAEQIDYDKMVFEQITGESFYEGFVDYLKVHDARMLSVTRYKKTFLQNLMEKDHTRQMGYNTKMPLLILIGEEELVS